MSRKRSVETLERRPWEPKSWFRLSTLCAFVLACSASSNAPQLPPVGTLGLLPALLGRGASRGSHVAVPLELSDDSLWLLDRSGLERFFAHPGIDPLALLHALDLWGEHPHAAASAPAV